MEMLLLLYIKYYMGFEKNSVVTSL